MFIINLVAFIFCILGAISSWYAKRETLFIINVIFAILNLILLI